MICCRDALEFYLSVFGGEFVSFLASTDTPPDMPVSDAEKKLVMHVVLPIGSGILMGSDKSDSGPPILVGNNFSFAFQAECREQCDKPFAKRSEGAHSSCRCRRRSGARTTEYGPTESASTGW